MTSEHKPTINPLEQLALREYSAARHNGPVWFAFVRECEATLQRPWSEIREAFNELHRLGIVEPGKVWP